MFLKFVAQTYAAQRVVPEAVTRRVLIFSVWIWTLKHKSVCIYTPNRESRKEKGNENVCGTETAWRGLM